MIRARFEVIIAVLLKIQLFRHSLTKIKTGIATLETSVTVYQSTWRNIPKDFRIHYHLYVNRWLICGGEKQPLWSGAQFLHFPVALLGRKRSEMRETRLQVRTTRKALRRESNNVASNKFGQAVVAITTKWCSCFQGLYHLHSDWTSQEKLRSPRNNITPEYGFARQERYEDMVVQNSGFLAATLLLTILRSWQSFSCSRD
jgi:hypothetical protein